MPVSNPTNGSVSGSGVVVSSVASPDTVSPASNFLTAPPLAYVAIPPFARTCRASISLPCFEFPVRSLRTLPIISRKMPAPALELPLPK